MSQFNYNYNKNLNNETFGEAEFSASHWVYSAPPSLEEMAKFKEKQELKKIANMSGTSLALVFVISILLGVSVGILTVFGFNLFGDAAISQAVQAAFSIFSFTLPFVICFKIGGARISELMSFKKTEKGLGMPLYFMGLAGCSFANFGTAYIDNFFNSIGIDYSPGEINFPDGIFGFLLTTIAIAVVPALVEEFAMRGVVMGALRKFGDTFALITSSICFGVMHGNFEQMPFAFTVGLFLGFTVIKTGSMRVAILLHFTNNFVSVLFSYFPKSVPAEIQNLIYVFYLLVTIVTGIFFLVKSELKLFSFQKSEGVLSEKEKYKTFFLSGGVIVFLIINIIQAVSYIFTNLFGIT
ncbi:MAG: CPBP family intramembrane metalloprotease [Clostridia bacterium]|nr:CPBP family intramembrane metalloprotease [Clostridia bacterium]